MPDKPIVPLSQQVTSLDLSKRLKEAGLPQGNNITGGDCVCVGT